MPESPEEASLYDRVGGDRFVESLVGDFYSRLLGDPELGPFFGDTEMGKLHRMQRAFFAAALGGEIDYQGRSLAHVHHGRGITPHHLKLFITHLHETLAEVELTEQDRTEIIDRINTYADEIVGGGGVDG
jgi:hemoglobin